MASLFTEEEVADAKPKKKRVAKISSVGAIKDIVYTILKNMKRQLFFMKKR